MPTGRYTRHLDPRFQHDAFCVQFFRKEAIYRLFAGHDKGPASEALAFVPAKELLLETSFTIKTTDIAASENDLLSVRGQKRESAREVVAPGEELVGSIDTEHRSLWRVQDRDSEVVAIVREEGTRWRGGAARGAIALASYGALWIPRSPPSRMVIAFEAAEVGRMSRRSVRDAQLELTGDGDHRIDRRLAAALLLVFLGSGAR